MGVISLIKVNLCCKISRNAPPSFSQRITGRPSVYGPSQEFETWWSRRRPYTPSSPPPPSYVVNPITAPTVFDKFRHRYLLKGVRTQLDGMFIRYLVNAYFGHKVAIHEPDMPISQAIYMSNIRYKCKY